MTNPDFILPAQAMGVHAIRCEKVEELPEKMKESLEHPGDKPVLIRSVWLRRMSMCSRWFVHRGAHPMREGANVGSI